MILLTILENVEIRCQKKWLKFNSTWRQEST